MAIGSQHRRSLIAEERKSLRFENFEVRNSETTPTIDLGEGDMNCWR
jgi:hypothetical protein